MGVMFRSPFAQLVATGNLQIFDESKELHKKDEQWPELFQTKHTEDAYMDFYKIATFGPAMIKYENTPYSEVNALPGGSLRAQPEMYALGYSLSHELAKDDKSGFFKGLPTSLEASHRFTKELTGLNMFNNGFTTTIGIDGNPIFYNQHQLLGGPSATNVGPGVQPYISAPGTYPNRPPIDIDPSYAAIQYLTNVQRRMIDSNGLMVNMPVMGVIIPPELRFVFRQLLGSPGLPGSANNDINALIPENLKIMEFDALTSQTAWFATAGKDRTYCYYVEREGLFQDMNDDFRTRAIEHVALQRYTFIIVDWPGLWGTTGAA